MTGNTGHSVPLLRFLGGAGTVTGSRFLIETPRARVLVDCGLFQGLKDLRRRNWDPFPVPAEDIDAVLLTHAHVDHSGYIPLLVRNGFRGQIVATEGTSDLSRIVLPDCGHLQEEEAAYANRKGFSKHSPALPLYTEEDAHRALGRFRRVPFGAPEAVAEGVRATFHRAGHILGSASIAVDFDHGGRRTILFTGDLGRPLHPVLRPPTSPPGADIIVTESTYGDREHRDGDSLQLFEEAIGRTIARGGTTVIPSFAVDRTEVILVHLRRLMREGKLPRVPVYVDSPMALSALAVYRDAIARGSVEIQPDLCREDRPFDPGQLIETRTVEESKAILEHEDPAIIISASGMATGGRVVHHLSSYLPGARNAVILVGYQAAGTRGRALLEGARSVKMLGRYVAVRAEIVNVPAFSVHADRSELLEWLRRAPQAPETVFVVHGEPPAASSLRSGIEEELGWNAAVPRHLEHVRVD